MDAVRVAELEEEAVGARGRELGREGHRVGAQALSLTMRWVDVDLDQVSERANVKTGSGRISVRRLDVASLASVRELAQGLNFVAVGRRPGAAGEGAAG